MKKLYELTKKTVVGALLLGLVGCATSGERLTAIVKNVRGCDNNGCNLLSVTPQVILQYETNQPRVIEFHSYEAPSVRVGDFNKDGHKDLKIKVAYPASGYRNSSIFILYGDGKGNFTINQ